MTVFFAGERVKAKPDCAVRFTSKWAKRIAAGLEGEVVREDRGDGRIWVEWDSKRPKKDPYDWRLYMRADEIERS